MQDRELYQHVLGLSEPWLVSRVELNSEAGEICVHVDHARGTKFCCPECKQELACYDHAPERRWRHLDTCQFKTILCARQPRVECPEHGVQLAVVPWAEKHSRFTLLFERFAIDLLLACQTVKGATTILRTSWDETWHILQKAVARGKARKTATATPYLGIDEKAFAKGHDYITLLVNIDKGLVEAISDGRSIESGKEVFSQLSADQIASIEAIAMDMSPAYLAAAIETIPLAENKIVHDRFHIMQHATKAVDQTRRQEHRELMAGGDKSLAKTKYIWLKNQENMSREQSAQLEKLFDSGLETGKAWGYKELLRDMWACNSASAAKAFFTNWYQRVIHTKLEPMKKVARMIKERINNVVSYCNHGITNAMAEGINSKIMAIKRRVGGYRNRQNFKTAVFFYCGGLELYPR